MHSRSDLAARLRLWLAVHLGTHYAAAISIVERAALAFAVAFTSVSLTTPHYWHAALAAGAAALVTLAQSLLTNRYTGNPAVASLMSSTIRARRLNGRKALHYVPRRQPTRKAAR